MALNRSRVHRGKNVIVLQFAKGVAEGFAGQGALYREMWLDKARVCVQESAPFTGSVSCPGNTLCFAREVREKIEINEGRAVRVSPQVEDGFPRKLHHVAT